MADVRASSGASRGEARGQLMLVAALGLAVLFVSLALIVNTAIFTENLATRGSDIGGGTEAVRYLDASRTGVTGLIEFANYHQNSSYDDLQTELVNGVDALDNRTGRQFAMSSRAVETSLNTSQNGTRIAQTEDGRAFTNASDAADWVAVQDVSNVRAVRMNVSEGSLVAAGDEPFKLVVEDGGGDTWNMTLSSSGADVVDVTVGGTTGSGSCSVTGVSSAWVNVTDGTLAGEPCEPLGTIAEALSTPYAVRFVNGDNATGTYSFVVDNDTLAENVGSNPHLDAVGGQPFATHAIYSANLTVTYETPQLFYNATVRVAPGEADG